MSIKTLCSCMVVALVFSFVQSAAAQNFSQLTTRRGALTGAVIGGIIGGQNDEVAAGIIAGGLVGGVTGRVIGNQANNYYGGGRSYAPQQTYYAQPTYRSYNPAPARAYYAPQQQYYAPRRSCGNGW